MPDVFYLGTTLNKKNCSLESTKMKINRNIKFNPLDLILFVNKLLVVFYVIFSIAIKQ